MQPIPFPSFAILANKATTEDDCASSKMTAAGLLEESSTLVGLSGKNSEQAYVSLEWTKALAEDKIDPSGRLLIQPESWSPILPRIQLC